MQSFPGFGTSFAKYLAEVVKSLEQVTRLITREGKGEKK
jgi:hypothetical protein